MRLEFVLKGNFDQYITRNAKGQNFLSYSQDKHLKNFCAWR